MFASEIDKFACDTYEANFGECPSGDITKIKAKDIPRHDILTAGFPCQPFSVAGKKQGFADTRGTLFHEIVEILKHHQPKYFILENVPGLKSHEGGETFRTIINSLKDAGYTVGYTAYNSKYHGVAQNRSRLYITGIKGSSAIAWQPARFVPSNYQPQRVIDILEAKVDQKYYLSPTQQKKIVWYKDKINNQYEPNKVGGVLKGRQKEGIFNADNLSPALMTTGNELIQAGYFGDIKSKRKDRQSNRIYNKDGLAPALATTSAAGHFAIDKINRIGTIDKGQQGKRVYSVNSLGVTVCAGEGSNKGQYLDQHGVRKLTPRECARLQGFPDSFKIPVSDTQAYKQFGNSVTIQVVTAVAKNLLGI